MTVQIGRFISDEAVVDAIFSLAAALCVSLLTLSIRVGTDTDEEGAMNALLVVLMVNVAVLVPGAIVFDYPDFGMTPRALGAFVLAGITGTMIGRALTYTSIELVGASRTEPIRSSQPLHATLIAIIVLGESVTTAHMLGVVLIVVGVGIVSWVISLSSSDRRIDARPYELLIPLSAALFYGIEPIFAKIGFAGGTPVSIGLAIKTVAALAGYLAYMSVRRSIPNPARFDRSLRRWYFVAGLFNTAFLVFYYLALEIAPVSVVVPIVTTSPVLVVALSRVFLPRLERITWRIAAAASIVAVGAVLTTVFS